MAETDFHPYEDGAVDGPVKLVSMGAKGDAVSAILLSSIAISLKRIADAMETPTIPSLRSMVEVSTGYSLDALARLLQPAGSFVRMPGESDVDFRERIKGAK